MPSAATNFQRQSSGALRESGVPSNGRRRTGAKPSDGRSQIRVPHRGGRLGDLTQFTLIGRAIEVTEACCFHLLHNILCACPLMTDRWHVLCIVFTEVNYAGHI